MTETEEEAQYYRRMHLKNLVGRAEFLDGMLKMKTYIMTSPIPPLLASQQENYSMATTVTRRRFSKEIAEELIDLHGAFAHFYALEQLEGYTSNDLREVWRDVLTWLVELTKGESK